MHMAKKVNGYMINRGGWIEFDQASDENGPWVPCTMVISDKAHERVFTESEVKAIVERIGRANCLPEALHSWAVHVAKEAGVSFDPA
jgi:hypothetical protein